MAASVRVAGPELTYGLSPTEFALSWPSYAADAVLEVTDELTANSPWEPVAAQPVVEEERNVVTLRPEQAHRFYRLRMP
jgi:hypothetical protein